MEKGRIVYFDFIKGIAISLVILGHCIQYGSGQEYLQGGLFFQNVLFRFIYSFHMPLFMIVSGYFFGVSLKKYTLKEIIAKKVRQLLIPVIIWSIISYLCRPFTEGIYYFNVLDFIKYMAYQLWFLWAVFYCSVVVAVVNKGMDYLVHSSQRNIHHSGRYSLFIYWGGNFNIFSSGYFESASL